MKKTFFILYILNLLLVSCSGAATIPRVNAFSGVSSQWGWFTKGTVQALSPSELADFAAEGITPSITNAAGKAAYMGVVDDVAGGLGGALGADGISKLTKSQLKSISSLEKQIAKHQSKLADYINDPMKFDNQGHLLNAPNDAIRQKIIETRINHLNIEIQTFQQNIQKILRKGTHFSSKRVIEVL